MAMKQMNFTNPIDPEITAIAAYHGGGPGAILEVLSEWQDRHGVLTAPVIAQIARTLNISAEKAFGVATFYSMLQIEKEEAGIGPIAVQPVERQVMRVCDGPVCWLCAGEEVHKALRESLANDPRWKVERSSCLGLCDRAPSALVGVEQAGPISAQQAASLSEGYRGQPTDYSQPLPAEKRVMMALAGKIDPESFDAALRAGVYTGLQEALKLSPEAVISMVEAAGLTGRGGAGFPVGRKWRFVFQAARTPKYIICNADESEPLIFKDRVLIDTNPHQLLAGIAIAGYACGAKEAFIYIRGEYVPQAERLLRAIQQAEQAGWLGENIQGSGFSFHIHVHRGAGAYICGEETALIESLEGKRGEPRNRPPYPPSFGYLGLPTLVNNVESYCSVPHILSHGAEWHRSLSSYPTPGTKMYMVLGHVNHTGLFEAPFGLTLRQVIEEFGGGMRPGSEFHFALTGGAAGTIVDASLLDTPIDYTSAVKGISLGAGSFLICDQRVSPVAFLRELLHFFAVESCGKCTPCRVGTHRSLEILSRLSHGKGLPGDIQELITLAEVMQAGSFCGLGQSVAVPVKSTLSHFKPDFESSLSVTSH